MYPTSLAAAQLSLIGSAVCASAALLLIAWGLDRERVSGTLQARQRWSLVLACLVLAILAVYWLASPLLRSGCC